MTERTYCQRAYWSPQKDNLGHSLAQRANKSEYLDDVMHMCGAVQGHSDLVRSAAEKQDKRRRSGKARDSGATRKAYDQLCHAVNELGKKIDALEGKE